MLACAALTAPTARAAETELWSATLTVAEVEAVGLTVGHGFVDGATDDYGTLSDTTFTHDSTDYAVVQLYVFAIGTPGTLNLKLNPTGQTVFNTDEFTLHVGSETFSLGDATVLGSGEFKWASSGLSWGDGDTVTVKLVHDDGVDTTGPTPVSAYGSVLDNDIIILDFNEDLDASNLPPGSAFTVKASGVGLTVSSVQALGNNKRRVHLNLSERLYKDETVTVSYADARRL